MIRSRKPGRFHSCVEAGTWQADQVRRSSSLAFCLKYSFLSVSVRSYYIEYSIAMSQLLLFQEVQESSSIRFFCKVSGDFSTTVQRKQWFLCCQWHIISKRRWKKDGAPSGLWHPDISWYPFHVRILPRLPRKQRSKSPLASPTFFSSSSSTSFPLSGFYFQVPFVFKPRFYEGEYTGDTCFSECGWLPLMWWSLVLLIFLQMPLFQSFDDWIYISHTYIPYINIYTIHTPCSLSIYLLRDPL